MSKQYLTQPEYPACQLIAAYNALVYFDKEPPNREEFEKHVDVAMCRSGSAIHMQKIYKLLGLRELRFIDTTIADIRRSLKMGRPFEVSVSLNWAGFHAVLVVGDCGKGFMIANWEKDKPTSFVMDDDLEAAMTKPSNINRTGRMLWLQKTIMPVTIPIDISVLVAATVAAMHKT